jgi:uncharacterized membrane protein YkoI
MSKKSSNARTIAIALPLVFVGAAFAADPVGGPDQVRDLLQKAGYSDIRDIEFDHGLWEAEARQGADRRHDIAIDPATGEIFDAKARAVVLDGAAVRAALTQAGYQNLRDLDRDGAIWEADATAPDGTAVEVRVSGYDGRVLHREADDD